MGGTCLIVAEDEGFSRVHRTIDTLIFPVEPLPADHPIRRAPLWAKIA